jgi:prolyl oligopeptidase
VSGMARLCSAIAVVLGACAARVAAPPPTPRAEVRERIHGVEVVDPYRWLEDRKSPRTEAWIEAQNVYTRSILDAVPERQAIRRRLVELVKVDTVQIPQERAGRYFFARRRANDELFVYYLRRGAAGKDEVIIDPHPWSSDRSVTASLLDVSRDGTLLAYGVRKGGEDEVEVRLLDVERRRELPDRLPKGRFLGVALKPDKSGFYYARHGKRGTRVHYHPLGGDPAKDPEIFGDGYGPEKGITVSLSEDGRWLLFTVFHGSAAQRTEVYLQDVSRGGPIVPVVHDLHARFVPAIAGDRLYLWTDWQAPRGRILVAPAADPGRERWKEVVPEGEGVVKSFSLVGGRLFVNTLEKVRSKVKVFERDGRYVRDIAFPTLGTVGQIHGRWEGTEGFFEFQSYHVPPTIYRYDVASGEAVIWARLEVPFDSDRFQVEQVWVPSRDGTQVPMFLAHRKGLARDGSNPTYLTGYGGFNVSVVPYFAAQHAVWLERGGVLAVPNLRGGGELGESWHRAGMRERKQNVFDDFLAAADWLVANRYTTAKKLAIGGGSNGGLLVGAALTQRPDRFAAVVCSYPLLDMIRYHKFLVARLWVSEYGSSDDPAQFQILRAYSPYHRVRDGERYPSVLLLTGDSDTRVDPLHARKMAARLQAATSGGPVLLRYDVTAGHSPGLSASRLIDLFTDSLSFLVWQLGR